MTPLHAAASRLGCSERSPAADNAGWLPGGPRTRLASRSVTIHSMPQGSIKEYDVTTKTGVIVGDDGETEWQIDAIAMTNGMFRFFRTGQRVTFDVIEEEGTPRVRNLRIGLA